MDRRSCTGVRGLRRRARRSQARTRLPALLGSDPGTAPTLLRRVRGAPALVARTRLQPDYLPGLPPDAARRSDARQGPRHLRRYATRACAAHEIRRTLVAGAAPRPPRADCRARRAGRSGPCGSGATPSHSPPSAGIQSGRHHRGGTRHPGVTWAQAGAVDTHSDGALGTAAATERRSGFCAVVLPAPARQTAHSTEPHTGPCR